MKQQHLKNEISEAEKLFGEEEVKCLNCLKSAQSKRYKLESQLEAQIVTYDSAMFALKVTTPLYESEMYIS